MRNLTDFLKECFGSHADVIKETGLTMQWYYTLRATKKATQISPKMKAKFISINAPKKVINKIKKAFEAPRYFVPIKKQKLKQKIKSKKPPVKKIRKFDCIFYSDCLTKAAKINKKELLCNICTKYEAKQENIEGTISHADYDWLSQHEVRIQIEKIK